MAASGSFLSRHWTAPAVIAIVAFLAIVAAIDPAGDYPDAPQGPGLTLDEVFNVQEGVRLVVGLRAWALGLVSGIPEISLRDLFGDPEDVGPKPKLGYHNPDHPPLGRIWLGLWHELAAHIAPPRDHQFPLITACARVGSAAAFALTVFLCGWAAATWYGAPAGAIAALSLVLMPRVFGHAHLAALETCIGLTYLTVVLAVARKWDRDPAPTSRCAALTGIALGAAMLTKIQGILLVVPIFLWAAYHWRLRAVRPLAIWGLVALSTFFVFWPWLWFHPADHFLKYLGRTMDRIHLYVWYFGQRYADTEVPRHFPAVMFLATVPLGLHLLGVIGLSAGPIRPWRERHGQLILAALVFPLILFSLPRVAVYDGERLFLVVFPLWAIFIGRGAACAWTWLRRRFSRRVATSLAACFLAAQAWGVVSVWPCFLSYYSVAVGGLRGAERLGLELDYWGEAVTRDLLEQTVQSVPDGASLDVSPVLHQFQLDEMVRQSPRLRRRGIMLHAFSGDAAAHANYLLVFRRLADLSPQLREVTARNGGGLIAEVRRESVVLAVLYRRAD